jgi:apolipoprotein N-acyltransferase
MEKWAGNGAMNAQKWILAALSGVLLVVSFPNFELTMAAWFALVPLIFAVREQNFGGAFQLGYVAGAVWFLGSLYWLTHVTVLGYVALCAVLALYVAIWAALVAKWLPNGESVLANLAFCAVASAAWVALEWARGTILGGFPWNFIGASQYRLLPLIQIADITGVYGVSFVLGFINASFFFMFAHFARQWRDRAARRRPHWEFFAAMAIFGASCGYGVLKLRETPTQDVGALDVALVQGNIPQTLKWDPSERPMILQRYADLTGQAALLKPEIIIWPETATPDPLRYDAEIYGLLTNLIAQTDAHFLVGTVDLAPFSEPPEYFNAAVFMEKSGDIQNIYNKIHLVPFGEYVPWEKWLPFLRWFTPITGSFQSGRELTIFTVPENGEKFGALICFEDVVPNLVRKFVQNGAQFMVNLTNDGWFKESAAPFQHAANAIFRAVENRVPLIRSTNTGFTCVIGPHGNIIASARAFETGILRVSVPIPPPRAPTFYTKHGDIFAFSCIGLAVLAAFRVRK